MQTKTAWQDVQIPQFATLDDNHRCDVVVIGGGLTGLTTAYLLQRAGKKVCVLNRGQPGYGDTGCTTAHLTYVTDLRLSQLVRTFGRETAGIVWQGGAAAINTIEEVVKAAKIACDFHRIPGFLHASLRGTRDEADELEADFREAQALGIEASYLPAVPYFERPGLRFANQARFHPIKYLAGLVRAITESGVAIFGDTEATAVESDPLRVIAGGKRVDCDFVVVATHVPLLGAGFLANAMLLQAKLAHYSSYAVGAKIPKGILPDASFWDTSDPYFYLRIDPRENSDYVIFGGEDHKTGQADDTVERFTRLERVLDEFVPEARVDCRWSGQVIQTNDGLPYIGEISQKQFVATGFSGNGLTFGTLAAMMACDAVLERKTLWQEIFSINRTTLVGGTWNILRENLDYPYYLLRDRLTMPEGASTRVVRRGQGRILNVGGKRIACSCDDKGKLTMLSPVCPHMGCLVHWNAAEQTWDCPCHGSRFYATGEVLSGPAESPLEPVEATPEAKNGRSTRKIPSRTSSKKSTGR